MIGDSDESTKNYNNYFDNGCHSLMKYIVVEKTEERIITELDRQSLGLPLFDNLGVKTIIDNIQKKQGCFIEGSLDESVEKIVDSIALAIHNLDKEEILDNKEVSYKEEDIYIVG